MLVLTYAESVTDRGVRFTWAAGRGGGGTGFFSLRKIAFSTARLNCITGLEVWRRRLPSSKQRIYYLNPGRSGYHLQSTPPPLTQKNYVKFVRVIIRRGIHKMTLSHRLRVDGGNHDSFAVSSKAVSEDRRHHRVPVGDMLPVG